MRKRLIDFYRDPYEGQDSDLPTINLTTGVESAWRMWTMMHATDWQHLPSELLDEDEALWSDISQIESLHHWLLREKIIVKRTD